jgi:hypothetical protein
MVDALKTWWQHHPARPATALAGSAARSVLKPVADRHPVALVVGAAAVGASIVAIKPWRWGLRLVTSAIGRIPAEGWAAILALLIAPNDTTADHGAKATTVDPAQEWPV